MKKTPPKRSKHPGEKMSTKAVRHVFSDRVRTTAQLAELYDCSHTLIVLIRQGKRCVDATQGLPQYHRPDFRVANSGNYRLTPAQARQALEASRRGVSDEVLAGQYHVHPRTIRRLRNGETYGNKI